MLSREGRVDKVRRYLTVWLCALWLLLAAISFAADNPSPPQITAYSAILVDAATGKVLYEKRCHARRPPASTTKIMTAILALEKGSLESKVSASTRASKTAFASLNLKPGETLTLKDLLYGLLLRSANDAAVCIAEHIAGSEQNFVAMMNEKARKLGAKDTHFTNPHGLYDPKHYSTAYDLALMARYAVRIPTFSDIVSTKTARIERSMNEKDVYLKNTARFLWRFNGADGIKTGYTREAGHCFVGSATRDRWRLISVVLKSEDAGGDTAALLSYAFENLKQVCFTRKNEVVTTVAVANGVTDKVDLVARDDLALVLKSTAKAETRTDIDAEETKAPVAKGEKLGTLTGYLNGRKVGSVDLVAANAVDRTLAATTWIWTRSMLTVSVLFLVGYISYGAAAAKAARRRRRGIAARG